MLFRMRSVLVALTLSLGIPAPESQAISPKVCPKGYVQHHPIVLGCLGGDRQAGFRLTEAPCTLPHKCVFPFAYRGKKYSSCINAGTFGETLDYTWCPTNVDAKGDYEVGSGEYVKCPKTCQASCYSNAVYIDGDITLHAGVSTARACQLVCQEVKDCGIFQYDPKSKNCWSKCEVNVNCGSSQSGATKALPAAGPMISGPKHCPEATTTEAPATKDAETTTKANRFFWQAPSGTEDLRVTAKFATSEAANNVSLRVACTDGKVLIDSESGLVNARKGKGKRKTPRLHAKIAGAEWWWGRKDEELAGHASEIWFHVKGSLPCDTNITLANKQFSKLNGTLQYQWTRINKCPNRLLGCVRDTEEPGRNITKKQIARSALTSSTTEAIAKTDPGTTSSAPAEEPGGITTMKQAARLAPTSSTTTAIVIHTSTTTEAIAKADVRTTSFVKGGVTTMKQAARSAPTSSTTSAIVIHTSTTTEAIAKADVRTTSFVKGGVTAMKQAARSAHTPNIIEVAAEAIAKADVRTTSSGKGSITTTNTSSTTEAIAKADVRTTSSATGGITTMKQAARSAHTPNIIEAVAEAIANADVRTTSSGKGSITTTNTSSTTEAMAKADVRTTSSANAEEPGTDHKATAPTNHTNGTNHKATKPSEVLKQPPANHTNGKAHEHPKAKRTAKTTTTTRTIKTATSTVTTSGISSSAAPPCTLPHECIFPFTYRGETHSSCTNAGPNGKPWDYTWCPTKLDEEGVYEKGSDEYVKCSKTCQPTTTEPTTTKEGPNATTPELVIVTTQPVSTTLLHKTTGIMVGSKKGPADAPKASDSSAFAEIDVDHDGRKDVYYTGNDKDGDGNIVWDGPYPLRDSRSSSHGSRAAPTMASTSTIMTSTSPKSPAASASEGSAAPTKASASSSVKTTTSAFPTSPGANASEGSAAPTKASASSSVKKTTSAFPTSPGANASEGQSGRTQVVPGIPKAWLEKIRESKPSWASTAGALGIGLAAACGLLAISCFCVCIHFRSGKSSLQSGEKRAPDLEEPRAIRDDSVSDIGSYATSGVGAGRLGYPAGYEPVRCEDRSFASQDYRATSMASSEAAGLRLLGHDGM